MKIKIGGNDSLSIEHKKEIDIFHDFVELLISSILNNYTSNNSMSCSNELLRQSHGIPSDRDCRDVTAQDINLSGPCHINIHLEITQLQFYQLSNICEDLTINLTYILREKP